MSDLTVSEVRGSWIDRYPSTPVKLIAAQIMTLVLFGFSIHWIEHNVEINETVFYVLAGVVFGADLNSVLQFKFKRQTAWVPPQTASEVGKPETSGQPVEPVQTQPGDEPDLTSHKRDD